MLYYIVRHIVTLPDAPTYEFFDSIDKLCKNFGEYARVMETAPMEFVLERTTLEIHKANLTKKQKDAVKRGDFIYFIKRLPPLVQLGGQPEDWNDMSLKEKTEFIKNQSTGVCNCTPAIGEACELCMNLFDTLEGRYLKQRAKKLNKYKRNWILATERLPTEDKEYYVIWMDGQQSKLEFNPDEKAFFAHQINVNHQIRKWSEIYE